MQLGEKLHDLIFEKSTGDPSRADAAKIRRAAPPTPEIRTRPALKRAPPAPGIQEAAAPPARDDPAENSFYILPEGAAFWRPPAEHGGETADDRDMRWLDEGRIQNILKNLRLDEPLGADSRAAHNILGYASLEGGREWEALARSADAVAFPIFAIDSSRKVIVWNTAMEELTGVPAESMIGKGDYTYAEPFYGTARPMLIDHVIIPPEIAKILEPAYVTRSGETYTGGMEEIVLRGRKVPVRGRATRIYDAQGRVTAAIQSVSICKEMPGARPGTAMPSGKTAGTAVSSFGVNLISSTLASRARAFPRSGVALPFTARKEEEDQLRQRRGELTTAFEHLTATEEKLLRNYEELTRTQAQLIESERKVRAQELFLKCVISDAREGIVAFDRELRYILWNRFMENLTGIPAQKVLGKRASELFPILRVAGADLLLERALAGETVESQDFSFLTPAESKQVWVKVIYSPLMDAGSAISGVIGVIQDTTTRKVMEYALQTTIVQLMESESKYRNVFNAKNDPLLLINPGTRAIVDLNDAASLLYGWSRQEMLGMSLLDLSADPANTLDAVSGHIPRVQTRNHRKKDGSVFPADVSADYFDMKGNPVMILSVRDLSGFQQTAESLRIANAKLNLMIGITRHDVLNNLTAVMGYNDLLQEDIIDERSKEMLHNQEKAIHTIRKQIEFTREYDDLGVKSPQWQNICTVASRAYAHFVNTISFTCDTDDLEVYADPLLERVFYNLFDNSFRYGEGLTRIKISCSRKPGGLVLIFEDDGSGVLTADKEKIFSRGYGKHTGLGLFLAREILTITRIGMYETGEYRKGARFEFRVPEGTYRFLTSAGADRHECAGETNLSTFLAKMQENSQRSLGTD